MFFMESRMPVKRLPMMVLTGVLVLSLTWVATALPANLTLSRWTVDGGGGTLGDGRYAVAGTIGQSDAGPVLSNGGYSLTGGFRPGVEALESYPLYLPLVFRNA